MGKLYITTGFDGGIYIGKPGGTTPLASESSGKNGRLYQIATDAIETAQEYIIMITSDDGSIIKSSRQGNTAGTWEEVYSGAPGGLYAFVYADGIWVAGGEGNFIVYSDDDGATWTETEGPLTSAQYTWGAYGGGQIMFVGTKTDENGNLAGCVISSSDGGQTWEEVPTNTKYPLQSIAYGDGTFVVVGNNGTILSL